MDSCQNIIGKLVINKVSITFILAFFPNNRSAEPHLLALPSRLPDQYSRLVVVTPLLDLSREPIYPKLRAASIFPVSLPASFGHRDFKISYLAALSRRPTAGILPPTPGLPPAQQIDYEKFEYGAPRACAWYH